VLSRLALMLLGGGYYLSCVLRSGIYRGHQRVYARAQSDGLLAHAVQALLTAPPARLAIDYSNLQESIDRDRISPMAAAEYADDTLAGYADETFAKGGVELHDQQRALAVPLIEQVARDLPDGATLTEIGAGNGDICAYLASALPQHQVVGVDLSTVVAERKHQGANLTFRSGYALDLLENGDADGDVAFAASTFVVFTPRELARYCRALADRGYSRVVLNEPTWGPYSASRNGAPFSRHLERSVWHHDYAGYLIESGYEITHWTCEPYQPPGSARPDIRVTRLVARRPRERATRP
jgi:trans-aconitate methyltransferase